MRHLTVALLISVACASACDSSFTDDGSADDAYEYPMRPGMEGWASLRTHDEMLAVLQVPEPVLARMSTEQLLELVLRYPLLGDMLAFDNMQRGFGRVTVGFNGLREFLNRDDAGAAVLTRYKSMDPTALADQWSPVQQGVYAASLLYVEMILSQGKVLDRLARADLLELLQTTMDKLTRKQRRPDVYDAIGLERTIALLGRGLLRIGAPALSAQASRNPRLHDFLEAGEPAGFEEWRAILEEARSVMPESSVSLATQDYDSYVYTPAGTAVPVIVSTWELSSATIASHNSWVEITYPNATRLTNASRKYNCHSYAWHSTSPTNDAWINTPGDDAYWTDGSYLPAPVISGSRVSYSSDDHSAIASSASSYHSKWGQLPVMQHAPCYSPYNCSSLSSYSKNEKRRSFSNPTRGGIRLAGGINFSLPWVSETTRQFCVEKGYDGSSGYNLNYPVGSTYTYYSSGGWHVSGSSGVHLFSSIECVLIMPEVASFANPTRGGIRLAGGINFSVPWADATAEQFCIENGYVGFSGHGLNYPTGATYTYYNGSAWSVTGSSGVHLFYSIACFR